MNPIILSIIIPFAVLAVAALGIRHLWRTKFKRSCLLGYIGLIFPAPGRVSLHAITGAPAAPNARAEKRIAAFRELGFVPMQTYGLSEWPGAKLHMLSHPQTHFVALVHEQSCVGTWSDVMRFSTAGEPPVLASNVLKHVHFRCLPGEATFHHGGAPEAELVRVVEAARAHSAPALAVDASTFPVVCERAYADTADRRFQEWPTENDIRRLVRDVLPDCELSDTDIATMHLLMPEWAANDWRKSCLREFIQSGALTAREWEQARNLLLVIHDHTPLKELVARACHNVFLTPEMKKRLKKTSLRTSSREEFERLNSVLPASKRYKKMGAVQKPVPADIYRAPLPGGVG